MKSATQTAIPASPWHVFVCKNIPSPTWLSNCGSIARAAAGDSVIVWSRSTRVDSDLLRASADAILLKPFTVVVQRTSYNYLKAKSVTFTHNLLNQGDSCIIERAIYIARDFFSRSNWKISQAISLKHQSLDSELKRAQHQYIYNNKEFSVVSTLQPTSIWHSHP